VEGRARQGRGRRFPTKFRIENRALARDVGHKGYVALYGIESPGLTASLAIA
jgi:hypothetical protein